MSKYETKRSLLESLKIPAGSRKVLIRIDNKNTDAETPSGILKIASTDTDWQKAVHSDRTGTVIKVPKDPLPFKVGGDLMPWQTTVEISEGWRVWFDFMASENADTYIDEQEVEYKLIDYDDIFAGVTERFDGEEFDEQVSTDGKEYVRPLNGFHLFEMVEAERMGKFDISPSREDHRYGIVKYVAKNNMAYENGFTEDHLKLKVGDKVRFGQVPCVMLEEETYCTFDGGRMYRRAQVRNVEMLWRDGKLILPKGRVLIDQIPNEEKTPSGIILLKANVKNDIGKVIISSNHQIPTGSLIKYIRGAGRLIDHEGKECRMLTSDHVLYVE